MSQFDQWEQLEITFTGGRVVTYRAWKGSLCASYSSPETHDQATIQHVSSPDRMGFVLWPRADVEQLVQRPITTRDEWMLRGALIPG